MRDELKRLKKAVREKCLDCSGGTAAEVALCELADCPLFPFRMELWPSLFDGREPRAEEAEDDPDAEAKSGSDKSGKDKADHGQLRLF